MDRRHFLSTSLSVVTAPALAGASALALPSLTGSTVRRSPAMAFSEARFRTLLGTRFRFTSDDWRGAFELTDIVSRSSDARVEQFTAVFSADATTAPQAGVYDVNHPDLGQFSLRIDGRSDSRVRQATFALLRG